MRPEDSKSMPSSSGSAPLEWKAPARATWASAIRNFPFERVLSGSMSRTVNSTSSLTVARESKGVRQ